MDDTGDNNQCLADSSHGVLLPFSLTEADPAGQAGLGPRGHESLPISENRTMQMSGKFEGFPPSGSMAQSPSHGWT